MKKIRILHIAENREDVALITQALRNCGLELELEEINSLAGLSEALREKAWDIVLSDCPPPFLEGLAVLEKIAAHDPDLPVILVSRPAGEEAAAEIMKAGAKDYILKDRLARLGPAIERELAAAAVGREKRALERQKRQLEEQLRQGRKSEAKGGLAREIAHNFNNILTTIICYSELAEMDLKEQPDTRRKVFEVIKAGNRAKEMVQQVLASGKERQAPRKSEEKELELAGSEGEESLPRGTEHLLVVDDEEIIVQFTKEILEGLDYQVTTAYNGSEAWGLFSADPDRYALMITDMVMPMMTGIELSQEILKLRPAFPIILWTGYSDKVDQAIVAKMGIRAYRVKPVAGAELARLVRKHLD
jgi:DNA-binding NtrC family response regulator